MYGQVNDSNTQKKKLVIVSAVMGIIILVLAGILVNAIINRNKRLSSETSEGTVMADEESSENSDINIDTDTNANAEVSLAESSEVDAKAENLSPVSNEEDGVRSEEPKTITKTEALPTTGPREALSLALLLGSVVMFLTSKAYLKELA